MAGSVITVSGMGRKLFMASVLFLFEKSFNTVSLWLFGFFAVALFREHYGWAAFWGLASVAATCVTAKKAD